jgi:hypothetical protein
MIRKIDSEAGVKDLGIMATLAVRLRMVAVELISLSPSGINVEAPDQIEPHLGCGVRNPT